MLIDLRSDTVTKPTSKMLDFMYKAEVGDDVFGEDPSIIELEEYCAQLFNKEAALFCPSGTMANQIAIKTHTNPGDEVICYNQAHVYKHEQGGIAFHSGCSVKLTNSIKGVLTVSEIEDSIRPNDIHYPKTSLVCLENTVNAGGGKTYKLNELAEIFNFCTSNKLTVHIDGARVFNAITFQKYNPSDVGENCHSISVCLSKGLGAPIGSVLIGNKSFILQARRYRKLFGGGMRQGGYLAAAGLFALKNHINRLDEDHQNALKISNALKNHKHVKSVENVETNIILFDLKNDIDEIKYLSSLKEKGILALNTGNKRIRFVTHLDVTQTMINYIINNL